MEGYNYDTFGKVERFGNAVKNTYAFTGREYDMETGLYYYRGRYYDPQTGRFISKDPIGFAGGDANLYNYVLGDPVNWGDPWGLAVTINIYRTTYTDNSIIGKINVSSTLTNLTFSGYTLENRTPANLNLPVAPGTYAAYTRTDHKINRIQLEGVPNAENVQIHNGNRPQHSDGCFLAGRTTKTDFVGNSKSAMKIINNIIKQDGSDIISVIISGTAGRP